MKLWPKMADCYQDLSTSPQSESESPFDTFNPHTSIDTIAQPKSNLYSPHNYQIFPSSTSQTDNIYDTFNSTVSDFGMLQNPIYHSNSFSSNLSTCC